MRHYDDERELMGYVFRNFPEIVRPRDCMPSAERVRDELPAELRDEYWEHALEYQRIRNETYETEKRLLANGSVMDIDPITPELRPVLAEAWPWRLRSLRSRRSGPSFFCTRKTCSFIAVRSVSASL